MNTFPKLIFVFIFLMLFLNGCTEMTRSEINLCVNLSSKSYAFVPNCETENSCFEKVSSLFKTNLGYEEESKLYEIKNHIAKSWYFYNLSLKEQKNIQNYCKKGDSLSAAGSINQAQDLINESFSELDLGMKKSFELISYEETQLSTNQADLLKEEKIYSNLIEFRQILSELNTGATNSDTYVSYYTKKAQDFAKSSASKGFTILIEKSPFWIENFELINDTILKNLGIKQEESFPFANDLLQEVISQAETAFFKKQSILSLQKFPIYEFMKLYSDLGGNNNSALKRFADLMNRTSEGKKDLSLKIQKSWEINENNLKLVNSLLKKEKEVTEFHSLFDKLTSKTITADLNITTKAEDTIAQFILLKEKKYSAELTKGEELKELLNFETSFLKIISSLSFKTQGSEEKLIQACKIEADKKITFDYNKNEETSKLAEEVSYFSSRVKNTTGRECILSCQELVAKKELLTKAIASTVLLEAEIKDSSKECVSSLEKIFAGEDLAELKIKFEELKNAVVTKENLSDFSKNCESIKKQAKNELITEPDYSSLAEEYKKLKNNLSELEEISFYLNESETYSLKEKYFTKALTFDQYFLEGTVCFEKIAVIKKDVLSKIIELNKELKEAIQEKIIYYVEKNTTVSVLNSNILKLDETNQTEARLILNNPFEELNGPIYIKLNFDINQIILKDACVDSVEKRTIKLFYLPKGKTKIDFFLDTFLHLDETDSFVYATNEISLLKREIAHPSNFGFQNILILTNQPKNTFQTVVLVDSNEILFANENNQTMFVVEKITPFTKIKLFYYLREIILLSKELIETKTTDLDETLIYKVTAKNLYPSSLNATLSILLPSTSADITVYSQNYTKKEIKKIGDKIILSNQDFLERETKEFEVWVKTSSALDFYKEGLEKQESFFNEHDYTKNAEETKKIKDSENLDLIKKTFESNSIKITQIELDEKNKSALELMKQKILDKISELRSKQRALYDLGLTSEAEKIGTTLDSIISDQLTNEASIAKAFDKLVTLSSSADNKLKSEAEKMWSEISIKSEGNETLTELKNKFFDKKQLFDEDFSFDILKTNSLFSNLQKDYNYFLTQAKEIDKNNLAKDKENQTKLKLDLNYCKNTLTLIENDLVKNSSSLLKAKFIAPLTQERIEKLKLLLSEIENSSDSIEDKLKKLEPLETEIWVSMESIKKQAILAFNKAIDEKASKEVLLEGKTLLDQNKYVDAYLALYNTTSPSIALTNFIWFLPIIVVIVVAFVVKNKVSKKENEDREKKKAITEEWDKL